MSDTAPQKATASVAGFPEGAEGVTPPSSPEGADGFLSDVIVRLGFVKHETVEQAVEVARKPGRRVDQILLESGALTEEDLSRAIAERYGLDHVDLDRFAVDMGAAGLISRSTALRYRSVPISFATDGSLIVAVADPVDALAISDLEVMTKSETCKVVASGTGIDALAQRLPEAVARQPMDTGNHAEGTPSPPLPASPTAGSSSEPSPSSATPPAQGVPAAGAPQRLDPTREHATAVNGDADRKRADAEARSAALDTELAEAYDLLRARTDQAEAERDHLQEQVIEATQERDALRDAVEQATQERDALRDAVEQAIQERDRFSEEARQRSAAVAPLLERAADAERLAEEAAVRIRELEDADRRAEAARVALREQREESERELEQSSRLVLQLRDELLAAEQRSSAFEKRLSALISAAGEAKTMAEELMAVESPIADDGKASEVDGVPQRTPRKSQLRAGPASGGASDQGAAPPPSPKPTI